MNRAVGKALHAFQMLDEGDRVIVGLSGGKDSLTLMQILHERQARVPITYELFAVYIDPGFDRVTAKKLAAYCLESGYTFRHDFANSGIVAHEKKQRENPCFICARIRRKRLFEIAAELDCNKLALGHHKDDLIETFFLNICYAGQTSTMHPAQKLFNDRFTIIRPLAFVEEGLIKRFVKDQNIPIFPTACPSSGKTKRDEIRFFLEGLYGQNSKVKSNIFNAMGHVKQEYLL